MQELSLKDIDLVSGGLISEDTTYSAALGTAVAFVAASAATGGVVALAFAGGSIMSSFIALYTS